MLGEKKKKIQVKSVEEYLKGNEPRDPDTGDPEMPVFSAEPKEPKAVKEKPNRTMMIAGTVVAIVLLALLMTALSQISGLKSEVVALQERKEGESQALKTQVADLSGKLERSFRQVTDMTERLTTVERELQTLKIQRVKAPPVAKKPAVTEKKKKVAGSR